MTHVPIAFIDRGDGLRLAFRKREGRRPTIVFLPGYASDMEGTKALALDRRHDRKDLARGALFVARALVPPKVARGPRVGVAYAKAWADKPLRFWWQGHPSVSATRS